MGPQSSRLAATFAAVCRGEGHSPPAKPCATAISRFAAAFSPSRRAGVHARRTLAISKIGTLRRRRARRDEGIPPYGRPGGCGCPVGRGPTVGRRGGIYSSRGHLQQRGVPGTIQASSPTEVCGLRRRAFKSWLARLFKNAPALAGAKLWWASQEPRHPRPKKQSAGLFFAAAPPGFQVLTGPFIKKCPRLRGGNLIGGPARNHATHALKNSPPDCFLRLTPPGFQVLAGPLIKKCPRLRGGNLIGGPART